MTIISPVIAGVDGSPSSVEAADYAAAFAVRRSAPLILLHGYQRPLYTYDPIGMPYAESISEASVREAELGIVEDIADRMRDKYPRLVSIEARQIAANPASLLISRSRHALVTVVGCRGLGGFTQLLLGSTSAQVAAHAHGPVIVVRPPIAIAPGPEEPRLRRPLGPVLACYDGSPASVAAMHFAAEEALARNVQLIVTHIYAGDEAEAEQLLVDGVKPWADDYEGLPIELRTVFSEHPGYALIEASRTAALTVVGSRGRGGFAGMMLGSVSRSLTHHAYGPVAVIHQAEPTKE